jgi:hypothetical protein
VIRAFRVGFIAVAIVLGLAGLTLSALILAVGSIVLAPFDGDED